MPMITVHTNKKLTNEEITILGKGLGERISMLPGKSEGSLMVEIKGEQAMFFRGEQEVCAFVDVRLFHESPWEAKKAFAESVAGLLEQVGIPGKQVYLNFLELESWGCLGTLK